MKKSTYVHTEKDGVKSFLFYILLPMAIIFMLIQTKPVPFNSQNTPIEKFELHNNKISFYNQPLGNKKFEINIPAGFNENSKLFAAYKIKDNKLSDLKSVSYNGSVIWYNTHN
jgi:hypothetical protein